MRIVCAGISLVPEGRKLFPSLSVEENLRMGAYSGRPGSVDPEARLRALSDPGGKAPGAGDLALRRAAADGGDRPRADGQSAAHAVRRAQPRPRAGRDQGHLRAARRDRRRGHHAGDRRAGHQPGAWPPPTASTASRRAASRSTGPADGFDRAAVTAAYFGV